MNHINNTLNTIPHRDLNRYENKFSQNNNNNNSSKPIHTERNESQN